VFAALADPVRRSILSRLDGQERESTARIALNW
jgi:hypothetical protein